MGLIVHAGGWEATRADLASVPVPAATHSYVPVPYGRFVEELHIHVPRFGLKIVKEQFALAKEGRQMFGVLTCENGYADPDCNVAIGFHGSYDKSLANNLVAGRVVTICDNLLVSGEVQATHKNTVNVFRDLPDSIYRMLEQVSVLQERTTREIGEWKRRELPIELADHLLMECVRKEAFPANLVPKIWESYEHPAYPEFEPRVPWSLYNAVTGETKTKSARQQMEGGLRLNQVFREILSVN